MLNQIHEITYSPLSMRQKITASLKGERCLVHNENNESAELMLKLEDSRLLVFVEINTALNDDLILVGLEYLIAHNRGLKNFKVTGLDRLTNESSILKKYFSNANEVQFTRTDFFQLNVLWHVKRDFVYDVERFIVTDGREHPIRAQKLKGKLYSRYVPEIGKTISFRMMDLDKDIDVFVEWQNQKRVAKFWEMAESKESLLKFANMRLNEDPHTLPMILEWDDEAAGYFEMYWTREDRLGPYYESSAYDRGFHFLIGNSKFLGGKNTDATLQSMIHFLFLDDKRTRKVMAEPRADNALVLRYMTSFPVFKKLFEFDFPHKRAAMIECTKERFIMGDYL